jgi:DNA-binding IscR family transcriptional regulator
MPGSPCVFASVGAPPLNGTSAERGRAFDAVLGSHRAHPAGGRPRHLTPGRSCNIISSMRRDSRLSGVLHVLLHMAQKDGPVTSEVLAKAMDTNPVVLRRVMAGLRDQGYVQSEKGHGGGWTLACDLAKVTLRDVYAALGSPSLLAIGNRTETPGCGVEQAVNAALGKSFDAAEALLLDRLGEVTLAALGEDVRGRLAIREEAWVAAK